MSHPLGCRLRRACTLALACALLPLAAGAQTVLRQGSNSPPGTVFHTHWQKFKAKVEADTGGAVRVELNTSEPNEANLLSNLRRGRVDCAGTSLQGAASVLPEVAVLQLPYLFGSTREVDAVYGTALTDTYRRLFAAKGLMLLHFAEVGFTGMYGTQPFKAPADLAGRKLRATQSRASQQWITALGAEPVVLPFADLVPSLQTGLIRGGEAGLVIYDAVVGVAAPHYTLTQHGFDSGVILCNKSWFDKLPVAQQQQVKNAWDREGQIRDLRAQELGVRDGAAARGLKLYQPTETEMQAWRAAGAVATEQIMRSLSPEAARIREEIVKAVRAVPR